MDEQAMVAAVLADPGDDTPRLVLADWLEEHATDQECPRCLGVGKYWATIPGTSKGIYGLCPNCQGTKSVGNGFADRAAFIRVQVELARGDKSVCDRCEKGWEYVPKKSYPVGLGFCYACNRDGPPWPDVKAAQELRARERELFTANLCRWMHGQVVPNAAYRLDGEASVSGAPTLYFSRGFVGKLICRRRDFTEDLARAVWSSQPVTAVTFADLEPTDEGEGWAFPDADGLPEPVQYVVDRLHRTRDEAIQLLSAAAVAWGRALAGLPPGRG